MHDGDSPLRGPQGLCASVHSEGNTLDVGLPFGNPRIELGLPCGQVVSAKRQADNDHIASCKNGNRYRVFVNAEGRVVTQKQ